MKKILFHILLLFITTTGFAQVKQVITPDTLPPVSKSYSQAVAVTMGRTIYIAGQVAVDGKGQLIGKGDFEKQTEQALKNLDYVLKSSGASTHDLVKINYYVVGLNAQRLPIFRSVLKKHLVADPPVSTLIGVNALFDEEALIEIDAIAVVK